VTAPGWALVTGAGKRLGRAVALDLAHAGWGVAVHYQNSAADAEDVADQARALGASAITIRADLADPKTHGDLIAAAHAAAAGGLKALVNCAAMFVHDDLESLGPDLLAQHITLNTLAPTSLARAFAKTIVAGERGAVVNFLDFKLASPYPDHFSYTLSKYALAGATELLARALAPRVRVNAVAPGYVLAAPGQSDADFQRLHDDTPLERGPTPEDAAGAVRFLLENPAVTGQTIYVDAGRRFRSFDRDMAFM
jgi:NAD(P)-dependent dehydrogenase (short-subunit alcohol dehydrogenase family)